jgi:hypothetical protein
LKVVFGLAGISQDQGQRGHSIAGTRPALLRLFPRSRRRKFSFLEQLAPVPEAVAARPAAAGGRHGCGDCCRNFSAISTTSFGILIQTHPAPCLPALKMSSAPV